tara:strand:+ start:34549 stop:34920 length:372 start_codon:yes stop_codon:yes gene_type:complete
MPDTLLKGPSRGRLFKLFTDFGPYFRKLKSDETTFFFDCLEICVNANKEPEERIFLGWWMVVTRNENTFTYERFNGLFDIEGHWVKSKISKKEMQQIDQSFTTFIEKLTEMVDIEIGYELRSL